MPPLPLQPEYKKRYMEKLEAEKAAERAASQVGITDLPSHAVPYTPHTHSCLTPGACGILN